MYRGGNVSEHQIREGETFGYKARGRKTFELRDKSFEHLGERTESPENQGKRRKVGLSNHPKARGCKMPGHQDKEKGKISKSSKGREH